MHRPASLCVLLVCATTISAAGQSASRYLPLDDWRMDYIEHLIRARVIADPDPLTRPLRTADILTALHRADTTRLSAAVRRTLTLLAAGLDSMEQTEIYRADMWIGAEAQTQARRDPIRATDSGFVGVRGGMQLSATFGPFVASSAPYFDRRLRYDPEYTGGDNDTRIPGRFAEAYLSAQSKYVEVMFGSMSRNWGPTGLDGLLVSAIPYSYDHLFARFGTPVIRFETMIAQLDDYPSATPPVIRRWWITQRAVVHPLKTVTFAFGQGTLLVGGNRSIEPMWLNPFKISQFTQFDEAVPDSQNTAVTGDLVLDLPSGWRVQGQVLVDDFTLSDATLPNRVGATALVDGPLSDQVSVRLSYQMVSALTYRSPQGAAFALTRRGVGLGHNFDDYDETSLSATILPAAGVLITPQLTLLRQGQGSIQTPFGDYDPTRPFLFEGVVERTFAAGLAARVGLVPNLDLTGHAAIHQIANAGHVDGATKSEFVGGVTVTYRFGGRVRIPL